MFLPYKPAQLYSAGNDWYIYYYYLNPDSGRYERFKERFNMNRIHSLVERRAYAKEAVAFVNEQLKRGFNPFTDRRRGLPGVLDGLNQVVAALGNNASATTRATYRLMLRRFADFVVDSDLTAITMEQVSTTTVERFRAWMQRQGLAAKTINDNVAHMGLFWDAADGVEANPWRKLKPIRARRNDTEDKFEPITRAEMQAIFAYLNGGHRPFARLALMIYYSWARTIELCRLRVGDVDLTDNVIHFSAARTKNSKGARVQIVPPLQAVLQEMNLQQYPVNYYLFSDGWLPGTKPKKTNEVSERWRELVKGRLGIAKSMYALKHTGNIDYLLQNKGHVDLKWQQMQNRHSSSSMTERYCRQLGAYFVDTDELNFTGF